MVTVTLVTVTVVTVTVGTVNAATVAVVVIAAVAVTVVAVRAEPQVSGKAETTYSVESMIKFTGSSFTTKSFSVKAYLASSLSFNLYSSPKVLVTDSQNYISDKLIQLTSAQSTLRKPPVSTETCCVAPISHLCLQTCTLHAPHTDLIYHNKRQPFALISAPL